MNEIRYLSEADDRYEISSIYEKSWKTAYRGIVPGEFLDSIPEGRWASKVDTPEWKTLVFACNSKLVGTCSFCASRFEEFRGYGEIISIYFLPEFTGKGYGRQLLERAISELGKAGYCDVHLWVLEDNRNARAFYSKLGFEDTDRIIEDEIGDKKLKEICVVRRI